MNACLEILACGAVRAWTWLYTLPLDAAARNARRREMASDLWELRHEGSRDDAGNWRALHILARGVLGMPDDLLWTCERLPDGLCRVRLASAVRFLIAAGAASGLVVSASGRSLNPARMLRVNIESSGWVAVASSGNESTLVPEFAFTLTNVGNEPTGALEVNALFHADRFGHHSFGTAFSTAVGWRGLTAGATSRPVGLRGNVDNRARMPARPAIRQLAAAEPRVKVFVRHEGKWTLLGDYPLQASLIQR